MVGTPIPTDLALLLGEINATVRTTASDIRKLTEAMNDVSRRVALVEHIVATIEAERALMKPQFAEVIQKVDSLERNRDESSGGWRLGKALWAAIGIIGMIIVEILRGKIGR